MIKMEKQNSSFKELGYFGQNLFRMQMNLI